MITLDSESSPFLINSSSQLGRKYLVAKRTIQVISLIFDFYDTNNFKTKQIGESFQIPKVLEWNNSKEKIIEIVSNSSNEFKNRLKESVGLHLIELKENSSKYKRFGLEQLLEHINWLPFCEFEDQDELNFDQLGIPDDQFADLKISSFFPNLEKLSLKYNNLTSFATISSELNGLKKLKHLELIGNPLIFQTILKTTKKLESINSLSINSSYPFYYLKHLLFLFPNLQTLNGKSIEFLSSEKTIQLSDSIEEQLSNISPLFTHTFQNSNSETISCN